MSELDLEYKCYLNIDTREIIKDNIFFYNTDKNIAKLYFTLLKQDNNNLSVNLDKSEVTNYTVKLIVINPNGIETNVTGALQTDNNPTYLFELPNNLITLAGDYKCELVISENDKTLTSTSFYYIVDKSITTEDREVVNDVKIYYDADKKSICFVGDVGYNEETKTVIFN